MSLALFYVYALVALAGALGLVLARQLVHSVMCFFATLFAIAAIFLLLGSEFLAAMQLFVYGGAITVLVLFALMFTGAESTDPARSSTPLVWLSLVVSAGFFGWLAYIFITAKWALAPAAALSTSAIAQILFSRYVLPFEIAGLALTIALIGAIVLAREDDVIGSSPTPSAEEGGAA